MPRRPAGLGAFLLTLGLGVAAPLWAAAPAAGTAVLYNDPNFHGVSLTIAASRPDLLAGMNARSVAIVGGAWELCAEPNFKGTCVTAAKSISDLGAVGLGRGVRSLRIAVGPRPVAGQTGPSLKGMASEFFPAPRTGGGRAVACPTGGVAAACVNQQAAQYCAALGYVKVRNVDVQIDKGAAYLADLLCSRT